MVFTSYIVGIQDLCIWNNKNRRVFFFFFYGNVQEALSISNKRREF
jgi:hypothetical protein